LVHGTTSNANKEFCVVPRCCPGGRIVVSFWLARSGRIQGEECAAVYGGLSMRPFADQQISKISKIEGALPAQL
jgi:hypothetical protein